MWCAILLALLALKLAAAVVAFRYRGRILRWYIDRQFRLRRWKEAQRNIDQGAT